MSMRFRINIKMYIMRVCILQRSQKYLNSQVLITSTSLNNTILNTHYIFKRWSFALYTNFLLNICVCHECFLTFTYIFSLAWNLANIIMTAVSHYSGNEKCNYTFCLNYTLYFCTHSSMDSFIFYKNFFPRKIVLNCL